MTEQAPNPDSRVTLSDERDPFGQRRARLEWRLSEVDMRSIARAHAILGEALRGAGLGELRTEPLGPEPPAGITGGLHHMGTARMHADPRHGVVDPNGTVHGLPNLHIAGSAVFPTVGYANPTLTIGALSLRLADHLRVLFARRDGGCWVTGDGAADRIR